MNIRRALTMAISWSGWIRRAHGEIGPPIITMALAACLLRMATPKSESGAMQEPWLRTLGEPALRMSPGCSYGLQHPSILTHRGPPEKEKLTSRTICRLDAVPVPQGRERNSPSI